MQITSHVAESSVLFHQLSSLLHENVLLEQRSMLSTTQP